LHRISIRTVQWTALGIGLTALATLAWGVVMLQRQLGEAVDVIHDLRAKSDAQEGELDDLHSRLGVVDRDLVDVRSMGDDARAKLLSALDRSKEGEADADALRAELDGLEDRVHGMRAAWEEDLRLRAAAGPGVGVEARYRELLSPTVRVGGVHEVGSGTVLWSRTMGTQTVTYVLTAWHVFQEDPQDSPVEVDYYRDGDPDRTESGSLVAIDQALDLALVEVTGGEIHPCLALLASRADLEQLPIFTPVYAIGCPLGYPPLPTRGEVTSRGKELDGIDYWMINAPTIFGNSGGGIYAAEGHLMIGVLSRISAYKNMIDVAVPHMGLVTPLDRVYDWLDTTPYAFVYRDRLREHEGSLPASVPVQRAD
jgi:S1-C subfamily serine protease